MLFVPREVYEVVKNTRKWATFPILEVRRDIGNGKPQTGLLLAEDVESGAGVVYDGDAYDYLAMPHKEVYSRIRARVVVGSYLDVEEMIEEGWEPDEVLP